MSSPPNPQHEPTMEEILASIRKIISEDQAEPEKSVAATTAPAQAEVLELTNEVRDDGSVAPVAMEAVEPEAAPMRDVPSYQSMPERREGPEMSHDELISDHARQALGQAFDALEQGERRGTEEQPMSGGTLDAAFERAVRSAFEPVLHNWVDSRADLVMEQLTPLIRQWMDDNLPALIENVVRNEIARAVRNRKR
ncbi:MAG: DUF2497 domain-containing protein [Alphaproteobacteria bacterium]